VVPVAFFAYFYRQESILDRDIHVHISLIMAAVVFLVGGLIATVFAGLLENLVPFKSSWAVFLSVGGIEEAVKLIFPVAIFLLFTKYRSEVDGLVFGIASGIGFAALESMGYGLTTLMSPNTTFVDLEQVLVARGLLAPLGHAAWTGIVCGAIWHNQGKGIKLVYISIGFFILAVVLHFLWDMAANSGSALISFSAYIIIGAVGLFFVFRHLHHARQRVSVSNAVNN
jgi:RsiW-degrading membrane proteinase PrsW (M82 family)